MKVAFDANCLVAWSSDLPDAQLKKARLQHLVGEVTSAGGQIVIAAPAFAEFLVYVDEAASAWLDTLERKRSIVIAPFDRRAAFECSLMDKAALGLGDKRGGRDESWQRVKIDRQIIAIARVQSVPLLVSNDRGLRNAALSVGMEAKRIDELDLPDSARQRSFLDSSPEGT